MNEKYRYDYMKEFISRDMYKCHIRMTFISRKTIFKKERNF